MEWGFLAAINVANGRNGAVEDDRKVGKGETGERMIKMKTEKLSFVKENIAGGAMYSLSNLRMLRFYV